MGNDMHDGTVGAADAWLLKNIGAYAEWAMAHNGSMPFRVERDSFIWQARARRDETASA
jgi:acid phosphatase